MSPVAHQRRNLLRVEEVANLGATELRELRLLREENVMLERLVADLSLDKQVLGEIVRK